MARRLRFGIIGLTRRWPRYRRALLALAGEVRPVAVHDPSPARCEQVARDLGAEAAGGVVELIERPDIDALLLVGGAWFGLWPLEQAARAGKPVLCTTSPLEDEANVEALREKLAGAGGIHVALWPALTVLREALADRLQESLGRPLFAQMTWTGRRDPSRDGDVLESPAALALLRECADLFSEAPEQVTAHGSAELASVILRFDEGRAAQLTLRAGPAARTGCRLQVEAENGAARGEVPRVVEWVDEEGRHRHELPAGMAELTALDQFVQAVRSGGATACSLGQACEALDWLRAARRAREDNSFP
jgi:predicted dehydrogenase